MRSLDLIRNLLPALTLALACPLGCGGAFVWVDDLPANKAGAALDDAYVIAPGDLLNIRVYNQDTISTRARVSPDGRISVPLVGELEARGARPAALAKLIEDKLKPFVVAPAVSITLDEIQPVRVAIVGEVAHPGMFTLTGNTSLLQALATAGGLTEYADRDRVFVLRARPGEALMRIRFSYKHLSRGLGRGAVFTLESGDTVVVE
jgi:polysaccharide export outer membrane protein